MTERTSSGMTERSWPAATPNAWEVGGVPIAAERHT
jgi:hypothetical protein